MDGDGVGEFGTFGEMTGADGVRTDVDGTARGCRVDPPVLSPALANVNDAGIVTKAGYCFRIFLPAEGGGAVHEGCATRWSGGGCGGGGCPSKRAPGAAPAPPPPPPTAVPGTPFTGPVDADSAERRWCAYAWPVAVTNSGQRAFFVDQDGDVWQSPNTSKPCSGFAGGPAWDAALPAGTGRGWVAIPAKPEHRGRDGNTWKRTN